MVTKEGGKLVNVRMPLRMVAALEKSQALPVRGGWLEVWVSTPHGLFEGRGELWLLLLQNPLLWREEFFYSLWADSTGP